MHVALPDYTFHHQLPINKNMLLLDLSFHQRGGVSSFSWIGRVFSDICSRAVIMSSSPTSQRLATFRHTQWKIALQRNIVHSALLIIIYYPASVSLVFISSALIPVRGEMWIMHFLKCWEKAKRFERNGSNAHLHYRESHRLKVALLPDI